MTIGIDASRAFLENKTGIEEYSYQTIKHLVNELKDHRVVLYLRKNQKIDFELPKNWETKVIKFKYLWTQIGLSLEILFHSVDTLFVPAHTVPFIHPKNTVVTIHGLEYEFCPKAYSFWEKMYMRCSIKKSCKWAKKIISVSENTKKDLEKIYKVPAEKIKIVSEGTSFPDVSRESDNLKLKKVLDEKYLFFVGRVEERKNVLGIIEAFKILKDKYKISHKLVLAGKPGYGYEKIESKIKESKFKDQIIELGFVSEEEKWELYRGADVFLFPSFYEGFGLPILEAQKAMIPVVASSVSSIPEVAGQGAILVEPNDVEGMAQKIFQIVTDEDLRNSLVEKGEENLKSFSWEKCAKEIAELLK